MVLQEVLAEIKASQTVEEMRGCLGRAAAADLRLDSVGCIFAAASSTSLTRWSECIQFLKGKSPASSAQPCEEVPELLPIHPTAASLAFGKMLFDLGGDSDFTLGWCMLALHGLNYFSAAGWCAQRACGAPRFGLSDGQLAVLRHILQSVEYMLKVPAQVESYTDIQEELGKMRVDYNGEVVSKRRTLVAGQVLPAWPEAGRAAVLDILDFVDGELQDDMRDMRRCLKPPADWPEHTPRSLVHATDAEWYKK